MKTKLVLLFLAILSVQLRAQAPGIITYQGRINTTNGLIAWRLSTGMSHALGRDWRVFLFGRIDTVGGAANRASPLVRRETGASAGLGLTYTWLRSETMVED